jgi:hypothetical protein
MNAELRSLDFSGVLANHRQYGFIHQDNRELFLSFAMKNCLSQLEHPKAVLDRDPLGVTPEKGF